MLGFTALINFLLRVVLTAEHGGSFLSELAGEEQMGGISRASAFRNTCVGNLAEPVTRNSSAFSSLIFSCARSSVVPDRKAQLAQARGVGDHVDLDDLAACDREIEDEEQMSTRRHNSCHGSIHESRSCALSTS